MTDRDNKDLNNNGTQFRSGFCAVVGRSNVGKSTLVNRFVGEKVAITSPKPQTTRNKIDGIVTTDSYQIVFEDTPGIHNVKSALGEFMKKSWESAFTGTDVILVVVDGKKGLIKSDRDIVEKSLTYGAPLYVAVNKTDIAKKEDIFPALAALSDYPDIKEIIPVSARSGENCDVLLEKIVSELRPGVKYFDDDDYTDRSMRFIASEIIREKVLLYFDEEIPHGVFVDIEKYEYRDNGVCHIAAAIICEKDSHKPIIIGKGGAGLKRIGEASRRELEDIEGAKVFLELFVKVREGWRDSAGTLNDLGYNVKKI